MLMMGINCRVTAIKKLHKDVSTDGNASICSNINSYLAVTSSIYIPHCK